MTIDSHEAHDQTIDWRLCTWEGSRLAQLHAFHRLSLAEKLEAIEDMCDVIRTLRNSREKKGLPVDDLGGQRHL